VAYKKRGYFEIQGWPEGHPHLTTVGGSPFGDVNPSNRCPLAERSRDGYAASFRRMFGSYKRRAAKNGIEFKLTEEDFYELTSQPCFYCGQPPTPRTSKKTGKTLYAFNGLDRIKCTEGYTLSNVHPCCWQHNDLKGQLSFREFYRQCLAVVLSVSSKTAFDLGDLKCLEMLIELFPNVPFLEFHREALVERIRKNPKGIRWNWLCNRAP